MEDAFKVMDKDGDGKLSAEDLKSYMQWAGFDAPDDDIKAMIKLAGCAAGGDEDVVTYDGLLKILALDNSHVA
jgi:calmodulin